MQYYTTCFQKLRLLFYMIAANKTRDPVDGTVELANSAHEAGGQPVRRRMLSHFFINGSMGACPHDYQPPLTFPFALALLPKAAFLPELTEIS